MFPDVTVNFNKADINFSFSVHCSYKYKEKRMLLHSVLLGARNAAGLK